MPRITDGLYPCPLRVPAVAAWPTAAGAPFGALGVAAAAALVCAPAVAVAAAVARRAGAAAEPAASRAAPVRAPSLAALSARRPVGSTASSPRPVAGRPRAAVAARLRLVDVQPTPARARPLFAPAADDEVRPVLPARARRPCAAPFRLRPAARRLAAAL